MGAGGGGGQSVQCVTHARMRVCVRSLGCERPMHAERSAAQRRSMHAPASDTSRCSRPLPKKHTPSSMHCGMQGRQAGSKRARKARKTRPRARVARGCVCGWRVAHGAWHHHACMHVCMRPHRSLQRMLHAQNFSQKFMALTQAQSSVHRPTHVHGSYGCMHGCSSGRHRAGQVMTCMSEGAPAGRRAGLAPLTMIDATAPHALHACMDAACAHTITMQASTCTTGSLLARMCARACMRAHADGWRQPRLGWCGAVRWRARAHWEGVALLVLLVALLQHHRAALVGLLRQHGQLQGRRQRGRAATPT